MVGEWKCNISVNLGERNPCRANILQRFNPTSLLWGQLRAARAMSILEEQVFGWVELQAPVFPGLFSSTLMFERYSGFRCFGCGQQLRGNCRCPDTTKQTCFVDEVCAWFAWSSLNHHPV